MINSSFHSPVLIFHFCFLLSLSRWFCAKHHLNTANPLCLDKVFIQQICFVDLIHLFFCSTYSFHVFFFFFGFCWFCSDSDEMPPSFCLKRCTVFSTSKLMKSEQRHLCVQLYSSPCHEMVLKTLCVCFMVNANNVLFHKKSQVSINILQ